MDTIALFLLLGYAFLWGLRKGSVLCIAICAPGLVPYISERGGGWKKGVWMAVIFSMPRTILLTLAGMLVAAAFFIMGDMTGLQGGTGLVGVIGYTALGTILALYGFYMLAKAMDERQDMKEGKVCRMDKNMGLPHGRFARWVAEKAGGKREGVFLSIWGGVLGLACVGETLTALEMALLAIGAGAVAGSLWGAMFVGGMVMFVFSIGAAIPIMLVAAASGEMRGRMTASKLNWFKLFSSTAMIALGVVLIFLMLGRLPEFL
ncbi:MAG: hypothetical protein QCI38_06855 [Candidatus Thermoplasmatota archaeon]|nr:hypothetical protein [Candidatus Thermoplasmatota archaeon]